MGRRWVVQNPCAVYLIVIQNQQAERNPRKQAKSSRTSKSECKQIQKIQGKTQQKIIRNQWKHKTVIQIAIGKHNTLCLFNVKMLLKCSKTLEMFLFGRVKTQARAPFGEEVLVLRVCRPGSRRLAAVAAVRYSMMYRFPSDMLVWVVTHWMWEKCDMSVGAVGDKTPGWLGRRCRMCRQT